MNDIISEIVKWLTEKHSTGIRSLYGFQSVLVIVVGIGAMISTKALVEKRNMLKKRMVSDLSSAPLIATLRVEETGGAVRYVATLSSTSKGFAVTVVRETGVDPVKSFSPLMRSLDEVDAWLRNRTPFILADFRN
ncbi:MULTISPECIES: hypothetical protein [unclassified Pseudomonas]|jgi:hypothetical protein|uniref:hypothetical protein n=1 Tax=unclassified Pseudomonas TaxID=196821 RepID=UPI001032C4C6|nr:MULTISPECIES: hypothetical protein [unclassified Pseudomonas]